jgi:hypothetical protein
MAVKKVSKKKQSGKKPKKIVAREDSDKEKVEKKPKRLRGSNKISVVTATHLIVSFMMTGGTQQGLSKIYERVSGAPDVNIEKLAGAWKEAYWKAADLVSVAAMFEAWRAQKRVRDIIAKNYTLLRYVRYGLKKNISPEQNDALMDEVFTMVKSHPQIVAQYKYLYSISKNNDETKIEEWKAKMRDAAPEMWRRAMAHLNRAAVIRDTILSDLERGFGLPKRDGELTL